MKALQRLAAGAAALLVVGCGSVTAIEDDAAGDAALGGDPDADASTEHDSGFACETCDFGCTADGTECADLEPTNGLRDALDQAADEAALTVPSGATLTFDTDQGTFACDPDDACDGDTGGTGVVAQSDAPDIAAFIFSEITIEAGAEVDARGENALALVAAGDVVIEGLIDVRPVTLESGQAPLGVGALPREAATNGALVGGANDTTGSGGGGGTGGPGARGGAARVGGSSFPGSPGGSRVEVDDALSPLVGGRAGGLTEDGACESLPGGGGGALQIVSRGDITVGVDGVINAGGGGGDCSYCAGLQVGGGGGGGAILIEARSVQLDGILAANGGGGASPSRDAGEDGRSDATPAQGAPGNDSQPPGGDGAARTTAPTVGGDAQVDDASGGGGGGGIGAIRVHTAGGENVSVGSGHISSPPFEEGAVSTRD